MPEFIAVQGDITVQDVDAVVNAANSAMRAKWGGSTGNSRSCSSQVIG